MITGVAAYNEILWAAKSIEAKFDKKLWFAVIDKAKVLVDGQIQFCFKNGTYVEA